MQNLISIIIGMLGTPELIMLLIIVVAIVFIIRAFKKPDAIHLKDGSIIHGKIIEQNPNVSVKIKTKDGNVSVFKNTDIEKIIMGK